MMRNSIHFHARSYRRALSQIQSFNTARQPPTCVSHPTSLRPSLPHQRSFHKPSTRRATKDEPPHRRQQQQQQRPKKKSRIRLLIALALPAALTLPFFLPPSSPLFSLKQEPALNPTTFTPFTITARTQVSPTAFIITVAPSSSSQPSAAATAEAVRQAWRHGLWSVEIKQPQLQVAREYTPLPPPLGGGEGGEGVEGEGEGVMRFLIRRVDGGEVSAYLARLGVGERVEVRGPRLGFDLAARAAVGGGGRRQREASEQKREGEGEDRGSGNKRDAAADGEDDDGGNGGAAKVVFLAGGTGIAPALQAARALLMRERGRKPGQQRPPVEMEVIWANRRREDCLGCGGNDGAGGEKGAMVALLEEMSARYGPRFRYTCTVDEEGSFIDAGAIVRATGVGPPGGTGSSWWPWSSNKSDNNDASASPPSLAVNSDTCRYHSAKRLVTSSDQDPPAGAEREGCRCTDAHGNPVPGSKNLLMVSGPDGFIAKYVGAKAWGAGKELQGPVRGVVGELRRRYPRLADDWLVLKM